jgi:hypothetical protein
MKCKEIPALRHSHHTGIIKKTAGDFRIPAVSIIVQQKNLKNITDRNNL